MDSQTQVLLEAVVAAGGAVRDAKAAGEDVAPLLAVLTEKKEALNAHVRPLAEAAKAANDEAAYEALLPAFEKVMTKGERKKHEKAMKKKKKAAAAAAAAAAPAAPSTAAAAAPAAPAVSMDARSASLLEAVVAAGNKVRDAKAAGEDVAPLLEALGAAKKSLEEHVRPLAEAAKKAGDDATYDALLPAFEKVMTKGERKKHEKAMKKKAKAAAAAAAASSKEQKSAPGEGGEKLSKSELKRRAKAAKKAKYKAEKLQAQQKNAANKQKKTQQEQKQQQKQAQKQKQKQKQKGGAKAAVVSQGIAAPADKTPYAALIVAAVAGLDTSAIEGDELSVDRKTRLSGSHTLARYFAMLGGNKTAHLLPSDKDPAARCMVDMWIDFSFNCGVWNASGEAIRHLDKHLEGHSYLVGYSCTLADVVVWGMLRAAGFTGKDISISGKLPHVSRWFRHCCAIAMFKAFVPAEAPAPAPASGAGAGAADTDDIPTVGPDGKPLSKKQIKKLKKAAAKKAKREAYKKSAAAGGESKSKAKSKDKDIMGELKGAVQGQVCTRFPPEPSGYLHIGHAKAVTLNNHFARKYAGTLLVRFDDTNPSKEKAEFEENIKRDLATLNVHPDKVSHTSDHFELIREYARTMIREGTAYMDNTPAEEMSRMRMNKIPYQHRDRSPEENMKLFDLMCTGSEEGQSWCMRAKVDMTSDNACLRDPVFYRANVTPHHRTRTKYKAYPTYDLACPIVDSHEGVTHAMRTTEYNDRNHLYDWTIRTLKLRPVTIQTFARVNFMRTLMSKRKLQELVDSGAVEGWNDPRFPTVQGIVRRGLRIPALKNFIKELGFGRRPNDMTWDKIWSKNAKFIDPDAVRYSAVFKEDAVAVNITNVGDEPQAKAVLKHPKDKGGARLGYKSVQLYKRVLVDGIEVQEMKEGETFTLQNWGNVTVTGITRSADGAIAGLTGEYQAIPTDAAARSQYFKSTKIKLQWVPDTPDKIECDVHEFGYLLSVDKIPKDEDGNIVDEDGNPCDISRYMTPVDQTRAISRAWVEPAGRMIRLDDIVQFQRIGFFRCDEVHQSASGLQMFMVPDGKQKAMSKRTTKLAHQ